jgi:23S rRNA (guanine745-N1)-methyltransferase
MIDAALPLLICPHCGGSLEQQAVGQVGCRRGHSFDLARHGYLPLLGPRSRTDTGDDAAMVAARAEFLAGGHYRPIADTVAARCRGTVLEIGAGTGYYLAAADPELGIALDSSRYAARRAARAHPAVVSVLADAWAPLPVTTAAIDTVLVIFAPRDPDEIGRVLRPGGRALVVTPQPAHLAEIRGPLGMLDIDDGKAAAVQQRWQPQFVTVDEVSVTAQLQLTAADLRALVAMGPTARHRSPEQIAASIRELPEVGRPATDPAGPDSYPATMAVTVTELRREQGSGPRVAHRTTG